jgi:hypothetical protein
MAFLNDEEIQADTNRGHVGDPIDQTDVWDVEIGIDLLPRY